MTGARVVVAFVGREGERARRGLAALEALGVVATLHGEATSLDVALAGADGLVVDATAGDAFARAVHADASGTLLPRATLVRSDATAAEIAALGATCIIVDGDDVSLREGLADVVARAEARARESARIAELEAQLAAVTKRTKELREHGATLAHDARVLFGIILGFASNLRDGISGPVDATQVKHLGNIVDAANDASALVDRHAAALSALALQIEREEGVRGGRADSRRRLVDVGELVRSTAAMFEGIASGKGIGFEVTVEPVLAWCDAVLVKQAVVNLVTNALKFTPRGGSVEVAALRQVPPSGKGRASRAELEIHVVDTGPGIPEEERERVFERGVRLARDAGAPGTGLGLSVVRDVARIHGGRIEVSEGPRGGAAFVLTLPTDLRTRAESGPPRGEVA